MSMTTTGVPAPDWRGTLDDGAGRQLCGAALRAAIDEAALGLQPCARAGAAIGLLADNGLPWALADLAALQLGLTLVPLPDFFTDEQLRHVIRTARLTALLVQDVSRAAALCDGLVAEPRAVAGLTLLRTASTAGAALVAAPPEGRHAARVTFTSGTTGAPKGVRLSADTLLQTAASLAAATGIGPHDVHVALLPLCILLENVGGLYRGLLSGARVVLPPLSRVGLTGSSAQRGEALVTLLQATGATTAILVPQTLACLLDGMEHGARLPALSFLGVGGAPLPAPLLARAERLGVPVHEGYGLSETGSVIALNTPAAHRAGSVGRPLPHVQVKLADDGEVLVRGSALLDYVGGEQSPLRADGWLATGDLGALDAEGFLTLHGRKGSVLRTAYGRKVSPEWVERELLDSPLLADAVVLGDGLPRPCAVLLPAPALAETFEHELDAARLLGDAVASANARLPDYARVDRWRVAREPFSAANGQRNAAGRLRRAAIAAAYADFLAAAPNASDLPAGTQRMPDAVTRPQPS